jgi:flavin reductase (DIM6/NTAB) family NADH-FMN oxidoreductase RutF
MSTSHDPELVALSVSRQRYTYECLTDEFVVNLPTKELLEQVWAIRTGSGRNVDEFHATGLTSIPAEMVKPPRIAECPTRLKCRIIDTLDTGDHTIFVGEVVAKSGDPDAMRDGTLNERIEPLFHLGGKKFLGGRERIDVGRYLRRKGSV